MQQQVQSELILVTIKNGEDSADVSDITDRATTRLP